MEKAFETGGPHSCFQGWGVLFPEIDHQSLAVSMETIANASRHRLGSASGAHHGLTAARHSSDAWLVEEIAGSTSCFCFLKPSFKSFTARSVELEDLKGKSISYQFQLDSEVEYHLSGLPPGQRLSRNLQRLPHLSSESQASVNSL